MQGSRKQGKALRHSPGLQDSIAQWRRWMHGWALPGGAPNKVWSLREDSYKRQSPKREAGENRSQLSEESGKEGYAQSRGRTCAKAQWHEKTSVYFQNAQKCENRWGWWERQSWITHVSPVKDRERHLTINLTPASISWLLQWEIGWGEAGRYAKHKMKVAWPGEYDNEGGQIGKRFRR